MEEFSAFEKFELQLNQTAKDFLKETAKWAYFLSIIGFIGIGFLVVFALFAGTLFSTLGSTIPSFNAMGSSIGFIFGFIYFLFAALYFFPVYYLNKFAVKAKTAFKENDTEALTDSLGYLKSHYKFIGVLILCILGLYAFILVIAIIAGLAS